MRCESVRSLRTALLLAVGMLAWSGAAAQIPVNDECSGATIIGSLPFSASQNTRLATPNASDPALDCADGGKGKTVWFVFTPTAQQFVTFSTIGSTPADYDIAMGVFTGTCEALTEVACNDDVVAGTVRQSEITMSVQAGTTYYIHIAEWNGGGPNGGVPTGGDLVFTASVATGLPPIAKGPRSGTLPAGVAVSTDPYGPESPFFKNTNIPPRVNRPWKYLPDPVNLVPPAAPAGSNLIEERLAKSATSTLPVVLKDFQGVPDQGTRFPPDPDLAVGPNHIIAIVNSRFRIYDKAGTVLKTIEADSWYAPLPPHNWGLVFDPQVIYDHFAGRWVMTWEHVQDSTSATMFISVSDDSDPLGTWYSWATPSNALGDSSFDYWDDYPQLGYDAEAIYVTGRMFPLKDGNRIYSRLRIFPKSSIYASQGVELSWFDLWDFRDPTDLTVAPDGLQASVMFGAPGVHFLMTDSPFNTGTYFSIWKIANPATAPTVTATYVPVTAFTNAPNAGQLGGGALAIETGGRRIRSNPIYRDSSLWAVHSIGLGASSQYSAVRYVRLNPFTGTLLEDVAMGSEGYWHYYASLMPDQNDNLMITFTRSGDNEYAGAFVTGRRNSDPPGLSPELPIKNGEANYVKNSIDGRNRWGDYNGIALDPADNDAIWVHTEYAASGNRWGNWIAMAKVGPLPGAYVNADPGQIEFPDMDTGGATLPDTLVLLNVGADPMTITSIQFPGQNYTYTGPQLSYPYNVPYLESLSLPFRFTPKQAGNIPDSVVIVSNAGNKPRLLINLNGRGIDISPAVKGVMYAVNSPAPSGLLIINAANGTTSEIGSISAGDIQGLAVQPSTGKLYGSLPSATSTTLYRINAATAEAVLYRRVPVGNMRAIAFSPGDTLYGGTPSGRLYRVNLDTNDTTFVGSAPGINYSSIAFDHLTGVLWASVRPVFGTGKDKIYTVDTATGDTTLVGSTALGLITPGIAFDESGKLFAIIGTGTSISQLYQLDRLTAVASLVGPTGSTGVTAIAIKTDSLATSVVESFSSEVPTHFELQQNYPNPFNPSTTIRFSLPYPSRVQLSIHNMLGQEVVRPIDRVMPAGSYASVWDGRTQSGLPAATGMYVYRIQATRTEGQDDGQGTAFVATRKMLLVK